MTDHLYVHHGEALIGELHRASKGALRFQYSNGWLSSAQRFPLSVSLPLRSDSYEEAAAAFFANLLPEAELRRTLCARLGLSATNDFALLEAIGGECAGALTIGRTAVAASTAPRYRELKREELEELAKHQVLPALDGKSGLRLSLAGAQDKLPVKLDGARIFLPLGAAPSTHILKFGNPRYKHLPANEVLTTLLAREVGLAVVNADLAPLRREGMCVIERYDRVADESSIERLHQEDLCQVLGLPRSQKYEKEGGPSLVNVATAIRNVSIDPLTDTRRVIEWAIFNVLAMNADGHAKNLSILHTYDGPRLAPLYDLVCTRAYPRLAPELAMAVGEQADPTLVERRNWEQLAGELDLNPRYVVELVATLAARFAEAVPTAVSAFEQRYGGTPAFQLIQPKWRKQAKRVARSVAPRSGSRR